MLTIENKPATNTIPLLNLGFRPFFLLAALFSVLAILVWSGVYLFGWQFLPYGLSAITWHAHEMIFGYAMAVIAGFLLTAVKNWTNRQTLNDSSLLILAIIWLAGRILPLFGESVPLMFIALIDNGFILVLLTSISLLLIRSKQWMNLAVVSILLLMLISNLVFYAGVFGLLNNGVRTGLYGGLYTVLALIFVMARRVVPFFIEKGVGNPVQISNWRWLDISVLVLFALFAVADLLFINAGLIALVSAVLFGLHGVRLVLWYTKGIWKKPLLWVLYSAYGFLTLGFGLKTLESLVGISPYLSTHAFSYGGIGMITIGMMSRVALGHTGRSVFDPPRILFWIFLALLLGAIFRVIMPIIFPSNYVVWIAIAQLGWIISFALFVIVYFPMLVKARVDGRYG